MKTQLQLEREIADLEQRETLRRKLQALIDKWSPIIGVRVADWEIRDMKTLWGSTSKRDRHIAFADRLADVPPGFLQVTVVHELVHLVTAGHDAKFFALMDKHLPTWRTWNDRYAAPIVEGGS